MGRTIRRASPAKSSADGAARPPASPWRWPILLLALLASAAAAWAAMEFVVWNKLPAPLVGKWVVRGGEQDGARFEFRRGGTMSGIVNVNELVQTFEANVRVE